MSQKYLELHRVLTKKRAVSISAGGTLNCKPIDTEIHKFATQNIDYWLLQKLDK